VDDTTKGLTVGLLTLLLFHGYLNRRAAHAAERQFQEALSQRGEVHAVVRAQEPFGLYANSIDTLDLYASDIVADQLPFTQSPRAGWKGSIRHLKLHLVHSQLAGMHISRLEVDIPDVRYDIGHALYKNRLFIRSAPMGPVKIWVSEDDLSRFAAIKLKGTVTNASVAIRNNLLIFGSVNVLGTKNTFAANGNIAIREGRYLDISDVEVSLNGRALAPSAATAMLKSMNPMLDVERDLHLGNSLKIKSVSVGYGMLLIEGEFTVPMQHGAAAIKNVGSSSQRFSNADVPLPSLLID